MARFTKDPWESIGCLEVDGLKFAGVILTPTKREEVACKQLRYDGQDLAHCYGKNAEKNAYLMAAAPDLYEAVKELLDTFCDDERWDDNEIVQMAKRAVAKAEGKKNV